MKRSKHLILEFTEFNAQRFNSDSVQASVHVDNPALSTNAFDKHEDIVRQAISRIGQLQGSLMGSAAYRTLKSKLALEDQEVQSLTIIRIVKNNNLNYDVYINFKIDEEVYWGVVKDVLGNSEFKSEVFKDHDLIQTKEWIIKLKGLIIKNIKSFLKPQFGKFKVLTDDVICYSLITGKMLKMKKDSEIEVLKSYDNKIIFEYENEKYALTGDNFIYFNWWFEPINQLES
jgi:hypothetical protein